MSIPKRVVSAGFGQMVCATVIIFSVAPLARSSPPEAMAPTSLDKVNDYVRWRASSSKDLIPAVTALDEVEASAALALSDWTRAGSPAASAAVPGSLGDLETKIDAALARGSLRALAWRRTTERFRRWTDSPSSALESDYCLLVAEITAIEGVWDCLGLPSLSRMSPPQLESLMVAVYSAKEETRSLLRPIPIMDDSRSPDPRLHLDRLLEDFRGRLYLDRHSELVEAAVRHPANPVLGSPPEPRSRGVALGTEVALRHCQCFL